MASAPKSKSAEVKRRDGLFVCPCSICSPKPIDPLAPRKSSSSDVSNCIFIEPPTGTLPPPPAAEIVVKEVTAGQTVKLCNRLNGNRFWVEITYVGGFNTTTQKKADSQGKSSFVQNFDAYLESKAKKPQPPPPEKPAFTFGNEPPPAGLFKFTGRVINAVAAGSPYAQGELICFHARHIWQIWREPEVLCASWNKTKVSTLLSREHPLTPLVEKRIAMGAGDSTVFDYCNGTSQPTDSDVIDAIKTNPKAVLYRHVFDSSTPLHQAVLHCHLNTTAVLLAAALTHPSLSSIVKATDANGRQPLHCAEMIGNAEIISMLNYPEGCKEVQEAVSIFKEAPASTPATVTIDPEVFELRRMPRVPVKPSLQNGMQSKRAARIEQLLRQRGIYECEVPSSAGHGKRSED